MSDHSSSAPNSLPSTPPALAAHDDGLVTPLGPSPSSRRRRLPALGIASLSLGSCDSHSLADKIAAAAKHGFTSIELFDLDWQHFRDAHARDHGFGLPCTEGDEATLSAAHALAALCRHHGVAVSCWQPLRNFEGFVDAEDERAARAHAKGILDVLPILGTDLLLCCTTSTPAPKTTPSLAKAVDDLRWLADLAATYSPPIRIMYEGLSFGAHRQSWQQAWEVVETADRANLGLCLDSFNTLALEWADPYAEDGRLGPDVDAKLERNMDELVRRVPGDKVRLFSPLRLLCRPSASRLTSPSLSRARVPADLPLPSCRRPLHVSSAHSPDGPVHPAHPPLVALAPPLPARALPRRVSPRRPLLGRRGRDGV